MRGLAAQVGRQQRLRDQACDIIGRKIPGNGGDGFQREIAGEDRQPPKHRRLLFRQQIVAPVQRRAQGLMPRQRGAPARGQQPEAVVEQDRDLFRPPHERTRSGELDGKRNAVEATTD